MLLLLCGCSSKSKEQETVISFYQEMAQDFIDNGDYDSAIKVLEEGITATDSEVLKGMLTVAEGLINNKNDDTELETKSDTNKKELTGFGLIMKSFVLIFKI